MIPVSNPARAHIAQGGRVLAKADVTLADGTSLSVTGADLMMGGMGIDDSVSGGSSLQVGAAIANRLTLTLNNSDGRYDDYDFDGATVVPRVGYELGGGAVEWIRKGEYGIEQPDSYGGTIRLTAIDNMRLLEVPYANVATGYPATLLTIVTDICAACGVTLVGGFDNSGHYVSERPTGDGLTCRSVISFAAQVAGCWARFDAWGRLALGWWDLEALDSGDADGAAHISAVASLTVFTDDVVVTGLSVEPEGEGEPYLFGTEGYVLRISGNKLVPDGSQQAVAELVGPRVVGMRFRPLSCECMGDPTIEAGDLLHVTDRVGREYLTLCTRTSWHAGSRQSLACEAESPGRNRAAGYAAETSAVVRQRNALRTEVTAREAAMAELAARLSQSSGLFLTGEEQQDGSTIWYAHNRQQLSDSDIVWRFAANGIGVSSDGGATYPYGLDVSGLAILERIYAIGIDAQYITTGRVGGQDGGGYVDFGTGDFVIGRETAFEDTTIGDAIDDARRVATDYLSYRDGELTLGTAASEIRNVMTHQAQEFRTTGGDVMAGFGLFGLVWKMFIETAQVRSRLEFGDFAWIARANGNMTLKWTGA